MDRTRRVLYPKAAALKLPAVLQAANLPSEGVFKVRIIYAEQVMEVEHAPYTIKPIQSLQLVNGNHIRYAKKLANRASINDLLAQRGNCDDILMLQHGFLTDTSYANVALFDGTAWYTPASPMLRGTRRAQLIDMGIVKTAVIREKDLVHFSRLRLMNSMIPWEEAPTLRIQQILPIVAY